MLSLRAMLHLELPHINVLSKVDLIQRYGDLGAYTLQHPDLYSNVQYPCFLGREAYSISADFNLDFYTEVQDLSYLENLLTQQSPRFAALNMAICSLVEDFGLVGFETLAVEVTFLSSGSRKSKLP